MRYHYDRYRRERYVDEDKANQNQHYMFKSEMKNDK